ncbi:MAG: Rne/Rng family ribonuclease [Bdellovibrionota bacterium]
MTASEILISRSIGETRVARLENGELTEFLVEREHDKALLGGIYKGKVARVLPGMQAAFIDLGLAKTGFLYVDLVVDPLAKNQEADIDLVVDPEERELADEAEEEAPDTAATPVFPKRREGRPIQDLLKEGNEVMVQITKEPLGSKGPRLTGYVSLPGRYLVYLPDSTTVGVSRRIEDSEERDRLKEIVDRIRPPKGGVIVRTVAEGATEKNLKDDLEYILKVWGNLKKNFDKQKSIGLMWQDFDLALRIVRDRVTDDVDRILVDDEHLHKQMTKYMQLFSSKLKKRLEMFSGSLSLFESYGIETEVKRATSRKVWLKSGGYILIDETEALISIDVNTGRFVGKRNLSETLLQTNLEALKEIAYQIRLRNLGGIIVVDFIDMDRAEHRDQVFAAFSEELKKDPVKTQVYPISGLGLVELTRKRTRESLSKTLAGSCPLCDGWGRVESKETYAYRLFRACEKESRMASDGQSLVVYLPPDMAAYITESMKSYLEELEKRMGRSLSIRVDAHLAHRDFEVYAHDV